MTETKTEEQATSVLFVDYPQNPFQYHITCKFTDFEEDYDYVIRSELVDVANG